MNEEDIRKKICELLSRNPGLHISKIADVLTMKISEVETQLQILEQQNVITVTHETGYPRYFLRESHGTIRDTRSGQLKGEIFSLIAHNPGLHLSKIAETLQISIPLADYHLTQMEKNKEIFSVKETPEYHKRFYIAGGYVESNEKKILDELKKKIPLQIVLYLLKNPLMQHKELLEHLRIASSTLSYHLTNLIQCGILEVQSRGTEKGYSLKNKEEIKKILKKYELHIELNVTLESFKDMWGEWDYHDALG